MNKKMYQKMEKMTDNEKFLYLNFLKAFTHLQIINLFF